MATKIIETTVRGEPAAQTPNAVKFLKNITETARQFPENYTQDK